MEITFHANTPSKRSLPSFICSLFVREKGAENIPRQREQQFYAKSPIHSHERFAGGNCNCKHCKRTDAMGWYQGIKMQTSCSRRMEKCATDKQIHRRCFSVSDFLLEEVSSSEQKHRMQTIQGWLIFSHHLANSEQGEGGSVVFRFEFEISC